MIYTVSARHRVDGFRRRFAVVAEDGVKAMNIVAEYLDPAEYDSWRAYPTKYGNIIEIGMGGDVGVRGVY